MKPTYYPGQLLRVTRNFIGINPVTGRLHNFMQDDVFFLVSIEKEDPYLEPEHYDTTLVTNTGELVVVEWYRAGFIKCWTPASP
jgi:hypothetical protein